MPSLKLDGRDVYAEMGGINLDDYPDFCDAHIEQATWEDTDEQLTSEELDKLCAKYDDYIGELAHESVFG